MDENEIDVEQTRFLEDPRKLRNVRTSSWVLILILAPLLFFALKDNFNFEDLLDWSFGAIIIFTTGTNLLWVLEIRLRAFEDAIDETPAIQDAEVKVNENGKLLRKHTRRAIPILGKINKDIQTSYNLEKTSKKIDKIEEKLAYKEIKESHVKRKWRRRRLRKKINKYKFKLDKLNRVPKKFRRFKPYKLERLLTTESTKRFKKIGDPELKSNPKKVSVVKSIIKMPTKGFTMALGGGVLPLFIVDDPEVLLKFYATYLTVMILTAISQYILTKYKTKVDYAASLDRKEKLQNEILEQIIAEDAVADAAELELANEIKRQESYVLNLDKDVVFKMDGEKHMVHRQSFITVDVSLVGYGVSVTEAYNDLLTKELVKKDGGTDGNI